MMIAFASHHHHLHIHFGKGGGEVLGVLALVLIVAYLITRSPKIPPGK
jgi:hypothetical protein